MNADAKAKPSRLRDATRVWDQLATAAAEFFEEGYDYPVASKTLRDTPAELQEQARREMRYGMRSVPDGCFVWIGYLVWLERVLDVVELPLLAVEVEGLLLLRRERNRFEAGHPPCPHCGLPNATHLLRCRECMGELKS